MSENKTFRFTLLFSVLIHSIFIFGLPHIRIISGKRPLEELKVTYCKVKEAPKRKIINKLPEPIAKELPDIKKEEILKHPKIPAEGAGKPKTKPLRAVEKLEEKKFETVVEEEQDEAKKATYISYYRAVREKIKQCAGQSYPIDKRLLEGEVFLSFVVASSGELLQIKVIDRSSINDASLRSIAIKSIKEASPFPPFPEGMSQYQITFNIAICFELNR